jgi:hypothetical protein
MYSLARRFIKIERSTVRFNFFLWRMGKPASRMAIYCKWNLEVQKFSFDKDIKANTDSSQEIYR